MDDHRQRRQLLRQATTPAMATDTLTISAADKKMLYQTKAQRVFNLD